MASDSQKHSAALHHGSFRLATFSSDEIAASAFQGTGLFLNLYAPGNWTHFEVNRTVFALSGEAYLNSERVSVEQLPDLLKADFPAGLDGSFLLIVFDRAAGAATVWVDRTASRKVLHRHLGKDWILSNGPAIAANSSVNTGALAAYLLNGIPLGGHTLFQDVHLVPGGTSAHLSNSGLSLKSYWSYQLDESFEGHSEKQLVADFGQVLFEAIATRLRHDSRPVWLSLSGGYDSTCILASALRVLGPGGFRAFSYETVGGRTSDADAAIAADVCRHWKVEHRMLQIPRTPLSEVVEGNARIAFATGNPCPELQVWESLDEKLGFASGSVRLFFGDNAFGHDPNWRLANRTDAVAWLPMPPLEDFGQLRPFLRPEVYDSARAEFAVILEEVLQQGAPIADPVNLKDFLYFEQRVQHALMPWRARFCGQHGEPVNPLLDARVLEYYGHVPHEYRRRRKLYRKTIETLYPEFFARRRATSYGSAISARSLLHLDAAWLEERVRNLHPSIAAIVSPPSLQALLPVLTAPPSTAPEGWKLMARRLVKGTSFGEAFRSFVPRNRNIDREVILLRLLIADAAVQMVKG